MTIFLAGASGAIGKRLVPKLVSGGHRVIATTRTPEKVESLRDEGADPVVVNGLDRDALMKAVVMSRPEVIVHEMTSIGPIRSFRNLDAEFAITNRLRTEGTEYLLAAAREAGTNKFVAQSYAGWPNIRRGGRVKLEDDPLDPNPPKAMSQTLAAIRKLETMVVNATGIAGVVLRYGSFYGPGTSISPGAETLELVRQRKFPLVGDGAGVWSFIHTDDAANATRLAIEHAPAGIYNIVDDEPAEVSAWLPELAKVIGAPAPRHLPAWLGRLLLGDAGLSIMTQVRGSSNTKAKRVLGWRPAYASWREGFRRELAAVPGSVSQG
jgi:nucleoside-diphosphate-sugar epimerase